MTPVKTHTSHNTRTDDEEKVFCIRCGHAGQALLEECPDVEPPYFDEDHYPEFYTGNYDEQ